MTIQRSIQLPLFEALASEGGKARPRDIYEKVAEAAHIDPSVRNETKSCADGKSYRVFEQQVRWARQTAVAEGLIAGDRGVWELTDAAYTKLGRINRGKAIMIYRTSDGIALWAHAEDAASHIEEGSARLVLTSPPYPVIKRAYGRFTVPEWLDWMRHLMSVWKSLITADGTIAINVMDVFRQGTPILDPYVERFTLSAIDDVGLNLAGRMMWHSPTKLGNIQWTAKQKVYPKNTLEHILLFSKSDKPSWDISRMDRGEYAAGTIRQRDAEIARGKRKRPSGLNLNGEAFEIGEGPLPGNLIVSGGASGNDAYSRRARAAGEDAHPARFPAAIPRKVIQLTTAAGDTVYDPMAGSNTAGHVASELGRRWISSDPMLAYVRGSGRRFEHREDFRSAI